MCSSGLAGTKQHEFFDGMYAIRGTIPPRPACGERIEVRGIHKPIFGGHNYRADQSRDRTRSEFLARHGVIVLRFWNHQVRQELDSVLRAIWFALEERQKNNPSPSSSPFGKGRGEVHVPSVE